MAGISSMCRLGKLARLFVGVIVFLLLLTVFHIGRPVKLSMYELRQTRDEQEQGDNPPTGPTWRRVFKTYNSSSTQAAPFTVFPTAKTSEQLLKPNWNTYTFTSPKVKTEAVKLKVKTMYETAKKLRPNYVNPKLSFDKFTIIMLSYNRTGNLHTIFNHYCSMSRIIDKIIIVWNNIGVPIPADLQSVECSFPIVILPQTRNSLNNRFIPYPEIDTECVFSLDDDHLMTEESLEAGFNIWKTFPHLLVGYVPRTHGRKQEQYYYQREPVRHGETYSIVLTVAMYMNYKYMDLYTNHAHKEIIDFTDSNQNGEDIAMVAVVGDYLEKVDRKQCGCLWVREPMTEIKSKKDKGKPKGLHHLARHFEERDDCMNLLSQVYGKLPIQYCSIEVRRKK